MAVAPENLALPAHTAIACALFRTRSVFEAAQAAVPRVHEAAPDAASGGAGGAAAPANAEAAAKRAEAAAAAAAAAEKGTAILNLLLEVVDSGVATLRAVAAGEGIDAAAAPSEEAIAAATRVLRERGALAPGDDAEAGLAGSLSAATGPVLRVSDAAPACVRGLDGQKLSDVARRLRLCVDAARTCCEAPLGSDARWEARRTAVAEQFAPYELVGTETVKTDHSKRATRLLGRLASAEPTNAKEARARVVARLILTAGNKVYINTYRLGPAGSPLGELFSVHIVGKNDKNLVQLARGHPEHGFPRGFFLVCYFPGEGTGLSDEEDAATAKAAYKAATDGAAAAAALPGEEADALLVSAGFLDKFENDTRQVAVDFNDFAGASAIYLTLKASGSLGILVAFSHRGQRFAMVTSKNASGNVYARELPITLAAWYAGTDGLVRLLDMLHDTESVLCSEVCSMAAGMGHHAARYAINVPISLVVGNVSGTGRITQPVESMADVAAEYDLPALSQWAYRSSAVGELPMDSSVGLPVPVVTAMKALSARRDTLTYDGFHELMEEHSVAFHRLLDGKLHHSDLTDVLEGLVIRIEYADPEKPLHHVKFKFANYTVRTMCIRGLVAEGRGDQPALVPPGRPLAVHRVKDDIGEYLNRWVVDARHRPYYTALILHALRAVTAQPPYAHIDSSNYLDIVEPAIDEFVAQGDTWESAINAEDRELFWHLQPSAEDVQVVLVALVGPVGSGKSTLQGQLEELGLRGPDVDEFTENTGNFTNTKQSAVYGSAALALREDGVAVCGNGGGIFYYGQGRSRAKRFQFGSLFRPALLTRVSSANVLKPVMLAPAELVAAVKEALAAHDAGGAGAAGAAGGAADDESDDDAAEAVNGSRIRGHPAVVAVQRTFMARTRAEVPARVERGKYTLGVRSPFGGLVRPTKNRESEETLEQLTTSLVQVSNRNFDLIVDMLVKLLHRGADGGEDTRAAMGMGAPAEVYGWAPSEGSSPQSPGFYITAPDGARMTVADFAAAMRAKVVGDPKRIALVPKAWIGIRASFRYSKTMVRGGKTVDLSMLVVSHCTIHFAASSGDVPNALSRLNAYFKANPERTAWKGRIVDVAPEDPDEFPAAQVKKWPIPDACFVVAIDVADGLVELIDELGITFRGAAAWKRAAHLTVSAPYEAKFNGLAVLAARDVEEGKEGATGTFTAVVPKDKKFAPRRAKWTARMREGVVVEGTWEAPYWMPWT